MNMQPTSMAKRIHAVDALRGFALLGVLFANIPYAGPETIQGAWDSTFTFLSNLLISQKFITMFSILFGFGFYIQMKKAEDNRVHFIRYFMVRMALLFLIGVIHSYGLWNGDILMSYALGGVFLLVVRKWSMKRLLILAIVFNVILTGAIFIGNSALGWQIYDYDYALDKEYPITPSYIRYMTINYIMNPWTNFLKDLPITLVFTFGNMLIGVILGKLNFFRMPESVKNLKWYFIAIGGTFGFTASFFYHKIMSGEIDLDVPLLWVPFVLCGGLVLHSLFYISLFVSAYHHPVFRKALGFFNSVGRTALSNYLLQSVFYVTLFYHCTHLLQLFGKLTIGETFVVALLLFIVQSGISYLWLKKYPQGPVEYIWKKISYGVANRTQNTQ
jgi:uncharacterized protein